VFLYRGFAVSNGTWRGGREAEGGGLLNRYTAQKLYRGFESLPLRPGGHETVEADMKRMWLGAVALLGLIGCGGRVQHIWDSPGPLDVYPGPTCVSGPYFNPSGGAVFWDVAGAVGDDMDVQVMPDGYGCDASSNAGYAYYSNTYWSGGIVSSPAVGAPAGDYNLAIYCYNSDFCSPYIHSFGYED
jgi:hypothetical protein